MPLAEAPWSFAAPPVGGLEGPTAFRGPRAPRRRGAARLAPSAATARRLRNETRQLDTARRRQRALIAASTRPSELAKPAGELVRANQTFSKALASQPSTEQDAQAMTAAVGAARQAEAGYADLAAAKDESGWSAAQSQIDRGEQRLDKAIRRLGRLPVYRAR